MPQAFILKYFNGGISDYEDKGVRGAFKDGKALSIRRRKDSLYCNQALINIDSTETPVIDQIVRFKVIASDGNTYFFGTSKIYKYTSAGVLSLVYTDPDGQIAGAAEWWISNGKKYLFWATSTKLKCKEIPGNADWSVDVNANVVVGATTYTYPKVNLTAATWHTMVMANGALMICNGNYLAMVGWDGSYTNEALRLLPDQKAKAIIDRDDYVIVACETFSGRKNAALFLWESGSLNYLKKKKIPAAKINALIDGEIMLMQGDDDGEIFFSDFVSYLPVISFPSGGQVNPEAIIEDEGIIYFGVYGSDDATKDGVYSYGRNKKNGEFALNFEYPVTCDEIGMLEVIGGLLHVSYKSGTSYRIYKVNTAAKQTAVYESIDLAAPLNQNLETTNWLNIEVLCKALPANTSIGLKYRTNKADSWTTAMLDGDIELLDVDDAVKATFVVGDLGEIFEVQVTLNPSVNASPEVYQIRIFFE